MQAPTTSGAPAGDPDVLVCPACRALNGAGVVFCWQCYRPFNGAGTPVPAPPPQPGGFRGVTWTPQPVPAPVPARAGRDLRTTIGAVVLLLAVVAGGYLFVTAGPDVELPESFGGFSQVRGAQVDFLLQEFQAEADRQGIDADMALYGSAGVPSLALIWVQDLTVPSTEEAFDAFATGFNEELGVGSLDGSRARTSLVDGISYLCAPVSSVPPANLCLWEDEEVFWILLDLSGASRLSATQDLAVTAHGATSA